MLNLMATTLSPGATLAKRTCVFDRLTASSPNIKSATLTRISTADLRLLFELYDKIFFDHRFTQVYQGRLKFSLSQRMTKSAGKTFFPRHPDKISPGEMTIEIRMGTDFFFKYDEIDCDKTVCGITTTSALEAFLLVFEHELCHVIEFIHFNNSNCSGKRFKTIAKNIFGHTASYHELPTHRQIARVKYGLKIGDPVTFTYEGKKVKGILYNINKRATVMVGDKNGNYTDKRGNRYTKYYVPLEFLV
ncbi:MAG: SprT-like domain-containing protein [Desulfotomaculaceae bacterium]|nr:SprT-like domain-containing protein [Desulfotomaculaceae bacterium]